MRDEACAKYIMREEEALYLRRNDRPRMGEAKSYRLIDLFCGAGGMTLGFTEAFGHNFLPIWANDFDRHCVETYNYNFGEHCVHGDITNILGDTSVIIPQADVVIGGPPCQGFSLLNKKRSGDPRNQLWRPYLDVVRQCGASVFVIENVPQLLGTAEHEAISAEALKLGFKTVSGKLCAADYGVAQTRIRAFIIGSKVGDPALFFPPRKTHYNPEKNNGEVQGDLFSLFDGNFYLGTPVKWRTVRDAAYDLPEPVGTQIRSEPAPLDLHFGRSPTELSKKRYRAIPEEGMNRFDLHKNAPELTPDCWKRKTKGGTDLFGRLWWDKPAFTIRTEFYKPEKGRYLHPEQHRPITHREAARLQSFPDSFQFRGTKIEIAKQIGNAVPPLLAARVADIIYLMLQMNEESKRPALSRRGEVMCRSSAANIKSIIRS